MKTRRWDFVSAHAKTFGVQRICRVLQVSRSGYYRWLASAKAREERQAAEDELVAEIREIHTAHKGTYGVRRVHAELRGFGHTVNRKRTTVPDWLAPPAPDLVQRQFTAARLDEKWCGDITYVQLGGTWLYLACVIDICSRRVLGYSMASYMRAELVIDALTMAVATRGGNATGVIFHADRGSQYTSAAFAEVCDGFGIRRSTGRSARATTTPSPSRSGRGSRETMHQRLFSTVRQARLEIFQWLTYYNARRRHSALNYLSPAEFEQQHQGGRKLTLAA